MESSPSTTENNSEKKEPRGKNKKKSVEAIGVFAVEPRAETEGKKHFPEHIGHVVIDSQAETRAKSLETSRREKLGSSTATPKNIETVNRAELLSLSDLIIIDGSSLRQVYETHLVGEQGLRRLVEEYMRGGDMKKALRREIVEREIDFERDPIVRDQARRDIKSETTPSALNELLKKATAADREASKEEVAFFKARAAYEADQQKLQQKQRRLIDISLASVIAILVVMVIILYFSRH